MASAETIDWLTLTRRCAGAARAAVELLPGTARRSERLGRGEGGDVTLAVDRAAEDAVFAELERSGIGLVALSEERGRVELGGGGPWLVVIDPVDGSLNSKRGIPFYGVSIAVADGDTMADVAFAYVADLARGEEWWAERDGGARANGGAVALRRSDVRLEILAVESAEPRLVARAAPALTKVGARRLRMVGSIALSLCYVAAGRFDGLVSLRAARSVDAAAGALIVREAGGAVALPDASDGRLGAGLGLDMRSRIFAGATEEILGSLMELELG